MATPSPRKSLSSTDKKAYLLCFLVYSSIGITALLQRPFLDCIAAGMFTWVIAADLLLGTKKQKRQTAPFRYNPMAVDEE